jgi:hypothetical protein
VSATFRVAFDRAASDIYRDPPAWICDLVGPLELMDFERGASRDFFERLPHKSSPHHLRTPVRHKNLTR